MVYVTLWLSSGLHELAHGLVAKRFGGDATAIGMRWRLPFFVYFYCKVEDVELFGPRRHRVATALAGVLANLVVTVPFFVVWLLLPAGDPTGDSIAAFLLISVGQVLINLLPLAPLDGYMVVCHALNMSRLASESNSYLRQLLLAAVRRGPRTEGYPIRARIAYPGYTVVQIAVVTGFLATVVWSCLQLPQPYGVLLLCLVLLLQAASFFGRRIRARFTPRLRSTTDTIVESGAPELAADTLLNFSAELREGRMNAPRHTADGPAVVVEQVTKSYGAVPAVDDVSFTVERGELFGILGPNGAGKTTLIEMIEGLRHADRGRVTVLGMAPWPRNLALLPRVGVQTQASAFFTRLTAREHIETVAALYGVDAGRAGRLLDRVGLAEQAGVLVEKLSGGQRQRLALAAALTHDPELIFLDEPTASLDPQARRDLWALMREIRAAGKTVIYTTHHLDEAEVLCDRVAIMNRGALIAIDRPDALVDSMDGTLRLLVPTGRISADTALSIDGVDDVFEEGTSLVIATRAPSRVFASVAEITGPQGIRTRSATLEDVYLRLTGTEYRP
jgi:ABC-type multidrug transport system ATPase subunit